MYKHFWRTSWLVFMTPHCLQDANLWIKEMPLGELFYFIINYSKLLSQAAFSLRIQLFTA